jgi:hypothetical protein
VAFGWVEESGGGRGTWTGEGTWEEPPRTRSSLAVQSEAVQGLWGWRVSGRGWSGVGWGVCTCHRRIGSVDGVSWRWCRQSTLDARMEE